MNLYAAGVLQSKNSLLENKLGGYRNEHKDSLEDSLYSSIFSNKHKFNNPNLNSMQGIAKEFRTIKREESKDSIHNVLGNNLQVGLKVKESGLSFNHSPDMMFQSSGKFNRANMVVMSGNNPNN